MSLKHMKSPKKCMGPECMGCESINCMSEGGRVGKQRPDMEKGVHQSTYSGGSYAGNLTKDAHNGNTSINKDDLHSWSKEAHREKLSELRSMKKPNLYSDGGEVKPSPSPTPKPSPSTDPRKDWQDKFNAGFDKHSPPGMSDGGEVEDKAKEEGESVDHEMREMLGSELMGALERKDKKAIMEAMEAIVLSLS